MKHRLLTAAVLGGLTVAIVVVGLVVLTPGSTDSQAGGLLMGDADCNQVVNAGDALADLSTAADVDTPAGCVIPSGDVDCNDVIDAADAAAILRYTALGEQPAADDCAAIGSPVGETPPPTPTVSTAASCDGPGGGPALPGGSQGVPQAGAYDAAAVLPASYLGEAADSAIEFALIPGRPNEAIIALQSGYLYRVALNQNFTPQVWGDVHSLLEFEAEQGLLSFAFSPNYENDCRVYLYYTRGSPEPSVLSRFTATPEGGLDESSERVLLTAPQPYINHNGGHIVFGKDGYLYLGLGDGGDGGDPENRAQDLTEILGKMIRINVSGPSGYTIPSDNPFKDGSGPNVDEIYALGLRNPFRFSSDPVSGQIWIGDVGQNAWEEIDLLQKGGNYGWDCREGMHAYEDNQNPVCDSPPAFIEPRAEYGHGDGVAVTGGVIYRGDDMPELYGWYVYADFYSGNIWALNPNNASAPVLLGQVSIAISSFTLAADGEIYLVSYSDGIFRLTR